MDKDADALIAVEPERTLPVLDRVFDAGDIVEPDDSSCVYRFQADFTDLVHAFELPDNAERVLEPSFSDISALKAPVRRVDPPCDFIDGQAVEGEKFGFHFDENLSLLSANDLCCADTFDLFEPGFDQLLREFLEFKQRIRARNGDEHDRPALWVQCKDGRVFSLLRKQITSLVELLPGMEHGKIHVRAPAEFKGKVGDSFSGNGFNPAHAGNTADCCLEGSRDKRLDSFGSDTGILGEHGQARVVDIGKQVHAQPAK